MTISYRKLRPRLRLLCIAESMAGSFKMYSKRLFKWSGEDRNKLEKPGHAPLDMFDARWGVLFTRSRDTQLR